MSRKTIVVLLTLMPAGAASAAGGLADEITIAPVVCGSVDPSSDALDYRQRLATSFNSWRLNDNNRNHLEPAKRRMQEGEYTRLVRADIEFLLRAWPNHYPGLEVLVRYDLAGGSAHDLESTECLFARARRFAPDDINVLLMEANYYRKSGETKMALRSYESALEIDPRSTDAHYHIALLYFELGRYAEADKHAQIAYDQGYPLPGLMNKLKQAGQWGASAEAPPNDHSD